MGKVLRIVYRTISTYLIYKAGYLLKDGATGGVTLIQRFGSALKVNIHFHIVFLDGVYVCRDDRPPRFQRGKAPYKSELEELVQLISQRLGRCLERQGLLEQDTERAWMELDLAEDTDAMPQILGSSVPYRIAIGPQQGRKACMIRTIRPLDWPDPGLERVAKANGFSLHAGLTWAQRLKRVFNIDIEVCGYCGGSVKVTACIEDRDIIDTILAHLRQKEQGRPTLSHLVPPSRVAPEPLPLLAGRESTAANQQGRY